MPVWTPASLDKTKKSADSQKLLPPGLREGPNSRPERPPKSPVWTLASLDNSKKSADFKESTTPGGPIQCQNNAAVGGPLRSNAIQ